ncbi:MAG TPA: hypothetical protein VFU96_11095 [Acidimicrobiia bacterium]|nr:hypothetical protein [Acidimicrobiia bacterium]
MTTFPGVATLKEDNVPVMVGLDDEKITLVSGEISIAEWMAGQYEVIDLGSGEFVIEAEDDSIPFLPDDPSGFALGIRKETEAPIPGDRSSTTLEVREGPPPKPATVIAFWVLAVFTAALGIWATLSLF